MTPDELTEDQIDALPLDAILAVDAMALGDDLVARLEKLPYRAYLSCVGLCIDDIRAMYGSRVFGLGEQLVRETLELLRTGATGASVGRQAQQLWGRWFDYMGRPGPDDMADTDLPTWVRSPCTDAVHDMMKPKNRDAAISVTDAAYAGNRDTNLIPGDNIRRLLKFIAWTRKSEPGTT